MRAVLLAMLLVFLTNASTVAQDAADSANAVLRSCKRYVESPPLPTDRDASLIDVSQQHLCAGMVDALFYVSPMLPPQYRLCPPGGVGVTVTKEQLVRVVVAYIERQPQRMHENFKRLALEALRDAWPCR
jgi:hypothetical protein